MIHTTEELKRNEDELTRLRNGLRELFAEFMLDENETEEDFQIAEQAVNEHYKLEEEY